MHFEILGEISDITTFAVGAGIREIARIYGRGRWRKRKGIAQVRLANGSIHMAEVHWYEAAGIGRKEFKIKHLMWVMAKGQGKRLVVCVGNDGYSASLERRKIYLALRDAEAEKHGMLRVVDESGEDYLYPKTFFRAVDLPIAVRRAVMAA